jgi:protein ECT2
VPIVTSETGSELIDDHSWTTFFILNDFEGPLYEAIYKTKHK